MLFTSIQYCIFLPIVVLFYFLLKPKYRWLLLLIASCYFYMAFIPKYILVLFLIIAIDYVAAIQMTKTSMRKTRRSLLVISIIANIGVLCLFKYENFFADNLNELFVAMGMHAYASKLSLILPIGLSFHTFQSLSYTIEVYYGTLKKKTGRQGCKPERHLGIYALYVLYFPQMVAGPIERPQNILPQLHKVQRFNYDRTISGLRLILLGFAKKILLADNFGFFVDKVYNHPHDYSGATLLLATYFFAVQIYCDFSGYSDIARGSSRILGIELMKNFNAPYLATSLSDFWKRWHISLSTWFRDYLYIPLGGNRSSILRTFVNLMLVFLVSGLWHGANWTFVIWGAIHGVLLSAEVLLKKTFPFLFSTNTKMSAAVSRLITFNFVCVAWVFFRANSLSDGLFILNTIATDWSGYAADFIGSVGLHQEQLIALTGAALMLLYGEFLSESGAFARVFTNLPKLIRWGCYYAVLYLVIYYGKFEERHFIYFQF